MKRKSKLIGSLFAMLLLSSSTLFACGGENSGKHMGNIIKINTSSFTIIDAETGQPMTFNANPSLLKKILPSNGQVIVDYKKDNEGTLSAVDIEL